MIETDFHRREFADGEELALGLAAWTAERLRAAIAARGAALLIVSGGKSPARFFDLLSNLDLEWSRVAITLADERRVADDSPRSNARLVRLESGRVTFTYKDYADASKSKEMTVSAVEFVRRWVQHVLPRGFVKIRHYGLLANRHREAKLALCRRLLLASGCGAVSWAAEPERVERCPVCGCDVWVVIERLCPVGAGDPGCRAVVRVDSS